METNHPERTCQFCYLKLVKADYSLCEAILLQNYLTKSYHMLNFFFCAHNLYSRFLYFASKLCATCFGNIAFNYVR